jgi:hypothetical protein
MAERLKVGVPANTWRWASNGHPNAMLWLDLRPRLFDSPAVNPAVYV